MLVSPEKKPPEDGGASLGAGPAGAGAPALGIFEAGAGAGTLLDEDIVSKDEDFWYESIG